MNHVTIDFETRSALSLPSFGAWLYSRHSTTEIMCLAYKFPGEETKLWHPAYPHLGIEESPAPEDLFEHIRSGGLVEAHNAFFERCIWKNVGSRLGWPEIGSRQWRCSASRASMCSLPRDLEGACEAMGLGVRKDMAGNRLMKKLSKPRKPLKAEMADWKLAGEPLLWHESEVAFKRLWLYCVRDVEAEAELSQALPELPERELELWILDQEMNERGVRFDRELAEAALKLAEDAKAEMNRELLDLTGIEAGTKRQAIKLWLKEETGICLPDTTAATVERFLKMDPEAVGKQRRVVEIMREVNKTSTSKYKKALAYMDEDDRIRDLLMYHGASTGRWAGRGVQVHNFPKGLDIADMDEAVADIKGGNVAWVRAMHGDVMSLLSGATRGMIIASEGKDLIAADYSAIEARVVLWLAGATAALGVFERGEDIYCDMATGLYGYSVDKKKHPKERQFGKQGILGLGFGMGFIKFLITCRTHGIRFTVEQVKGILKNNYWNYYEWVEGRLFPKDGDKNELALAKQGRNMLEEANEYPGEVLHELALMKFTVDTYRKRYSEVKALWSAQEKAAILAVKQWEALVRERLGKTAELTPEEVKIRDAITGPAVPAGKTYWFVAGGFLRCRLPSGRCLFYRDPSVRLKKTSWGAMAEGLRYWTVATGQKWVRTHSYGGKLVENITQATARDIMADAMLRSRGTVYEMGITVHDEAISEVPEGEGSIKEYEELLAAAEPWAKGCPIAAEAARFKRYRK